MSFTFDLTVRKVPPFGPFLSELSYNDLRCSELVNDSDNAPATLEKFPQDPWPDTMLHLYRDQHSTRGIEVENKSGKMSVRFMSLSSTADYELGFKLLEALARLGDGMLHAEDGESFPAAELRTRFGADWILQEKRAGANAVLAMVDKGEEVTIPCIVRHVHIGPRLANELKSRPKEQVVEHLLSKLKQVQYPGPEWFEASVMQVTSKTTGKKITCSVMVQTVDYLLGPVELLMIETANEEYVYLKYEDLDRVALEHCVPLDEKLRLVKHFSDREWQEFLVRAKELQVFPFGEAAPPSGKKWWEFWR
jgi:hypothetical protein